MIRLSVADVRAALARASGPSDAGSGEPSSMLLGRIFHEVFAELVSVDPVRSGLRVVAEGSPDVELRKQQLVEHVWRLLAPRLRRNAAVLHESSSEVMGLWRATKNLVAWLSEVVGELVEQGPGLRGNWETLQAMLQAEVPLQCELSEPGWKEPVCLVGYADSVLRVPGRDAFCAVELKLGRARPVVDLGQAAMYYVMLVRFGAEPWGRLAEVRPRAPAICACSRRETDRGGSARQRGRTASRAHWSFGGSSAGQARSGPAARSQRTREKWEAR